MIPDLVDIVGAPWKGLPPGVHQATFSEVAEKFATNARRRELFRGLMSAAKALAAADVRYFYLDGSYVTEKPRPGDYDGCWDPAGVNPALLDGVFFDFANARANQKRKYKGEVFPFNLDAAPGQTYLEFLQIDKHTGRKKGILQIDLSNESFEAEKELSS